MKILKWLFVLFFPPIAIIMVRGVGVSFVINFLLCTLGYFPGVLHAMYVVYNEE